MALTSTFADCGTVLERATMVAMINRHSRSPRGPRVTSPARVGLLTCGFALVTLTAATLNTPVAHADAVDPDCEGLSDNLRRLCEIANTPPTTTPSSGGSGDGFSVSEWVSDFVGSGVGTLLFFGGIAAVIVWVVIANRRETADEKQKRSSAELARGRAIAEQHHAAAVQQAHAEAAAQMPDPSVYDPMGMGVAPAPIEVQSVPAPPTDPEDLQRYATFDAAVPWTPGTAFAAVVSRSGDWSRARNAWALACEQAGLTETDENGEVTLQAELTGLRTIGGDDDAVVLAVRPSGLHIAEKALDRVREFLVVTAHVETASPFQREAATGLYLTTLRNVVEHAPAPAPDTAPVAGPESWEW